MVLNAFQRARAELPWLHPRHGMVHCQILSEGQLRRMAELDVTAFVQPVFINGDMHIAPGRLGGNRLAHSYACTLIPQAALTPPVRSASRGAYAPACWPTSSWWTATC